MIEAKQIDSLIAVTTSHLDIGVDKKDIRLSLKSKGCDEGEAYLIYSAAKLLSKAREE